MSEWKEVELGEIINLKRGYDLPNSNRVGGVVPIISSSGVTGCHNLHKEIGPGVVTGRYGTLGEFYYIKPGEKYWPLNTTLFVEDFKGNDPEFIYYLLSTLGFGKLGHKSAVPGLNRNELHEILVRIPDSDTQKEIARTLSIIDKKITLLHQQNRDLEELAQTLFKRWFVEFEFPNENGEPYKTSGGKMVESELGEIPEGWEVGCLGDEFTILMGQSPSGSSYNEIKEGKVFYQGRTDFGFRFPTNRLYTTEPKRIAGKFDVLVSVRAPVGDVNMASEECCIGRGLGAVKSDLKSYCFNKVKSLKKAFDVFENEGTVFGSLSKSDFNSLEVLVPDKKIAEKYNQVALKLDLKIFENTNEIQTLTQLRDTLLPKLMSGEVRVKQQN